MSSNLIGVTLKGKFSSKSTVGIINTSKETGDGAEVGSVFFSIVSISIRVVRRS